MLAFWSFIQSYFNYWACLILLMIGLYGIITKNNLAKKIIGMNIFQTAIILFFLSTAAKKGAGIPIIELGPDHAAAETIRIADYINPLPHVLMLTAIVVSVATLGVALTLIIKVYRQFGTLEEDEIIDQLRQP
ncbi:cation:proton antiporter subunit C [bacterium]|nr:cation:proton antiporter subunit C [bacterium]